MMPTALHEVHQPCKARMLLLQDAFAGANILGLTYGGESLEAAAVQAGEQLLGRDGSVPQASDVGAAEAAVAPAPTVDLKNNGL